MSRSTEISGDGRVRVPDPRKQLKWNQQGTDLWNRVLSLKRKAEGVINGESEDRDCNKVNKEDSEQDEVDRMKEETNSKRVAGYL